MLASLQVAPALIRLRAAACTGEEGSNMTTQLPALPSADLRRLHVIYARDLALLRLAKERTATTAQIARSLRPWYITSVEPLLHELVSKELAENAGARWRVTEAGAAAAARRFGLSTWTDWKSSAELYLPAFALGLNPNRPATRNYLGDARNFYACTLAALFDLTDPKTHPSLSEMRAALVWRLVAARCPDLMPTKFPRDMSSLNDPLTRMLYVRFCGLKTGTIDQATPALLRRTLPGAGAGVSGLRRALVGAALETQPSYTDKFTPPSMHATPNQPTSDNTQDFVRTITGIARTLRTPKARGGHFAEGQVAIAQLYDTYLAYGDPALTLDEFKSRLWGAVRKGAEFHLTRLDIPSLMDDDLRERSATPTRAGDVVHFVVLD